MSLHGPFDKSLFFYFGFAVWAFQVGFLILFVLRVAHPKWSTNDNDDNPDRGFFANFVPANAPGLSKATQFMALLSYCIFADESLKDIVTAVEVFPNFKRVRPNDRIYCMIFSCLLRFTQGMLATIVVFLLIIDTSDVIEIILNFTAINFISAFDNVAFELAQWGKYGPRLQAEANRIGNDLPAPPCVYRKYQHIRFRWTVIPILVFLMTSLLVISNMQESTEIWLTSSLRVQFKDDPLREQYNGCYHETGMRVNKRNVFESHQSSSNTDQAMARFGYCQDMRKWLLFMGNATNACDILETDKLAYSSRTFAFDISTVFEETWYSPSGTPLELYFFDEDRNVFDDATCDTFLDDGVCNDETFNIFDHNYDDGDCCSATCDNFRCGMKTNMDKAFNRSVTSGSG